MSEQGKIDFMNDNYGFVNQELTVGLVKTIVKT